jgi:hypothetical protein
MAVKRKLSAARQRLTWELIIFTCWLIAKTLPASRWYGVSLALSRFLARSAGWLAPTTNTASQNSLVARLLHRFLDLLAGHNPYFAIPLVVEGEEILREYAAQPGGFVCCSAHIPFVKMLLPVLRRVVGTEREMRIIAREPVGDDEVSAWNDEHWKAIRTDHAVLLHTRSLLRNNGCLLLAVDKEQGEFISSNIFRFVGKMHSRILMSFTQLLPDGRILLRIMLPPGPLCRSEEEIRANLDFVAENVRRILHGDKIAPAFRMSSSLGKSLEGQRSREIHRIQLYSNMQLEARIKRLQALLVMQNGNLSKKQLLQDRLALMCTEMETRAGV